MAAENRKSRKKGTSNVKLDWKKVTWSRPDFTADALQAINKLVASDDFDPAWEMGVLLSQGTHLKFTPEDDGVIRLTATFPDEPENPSRWFGVSASAATVPHALAGVLWRIDFVRQSDAERSSVDNPGGLV